MTVEETVMKGPLVDRALLDRSTNRKMVVGLAAKNTVNKKFEDK